MKKVYIFSLLSATVLVALSSCSNRNAETLLQAKIDSLQTIAESQKKEEANKKLVADFYQQLFGDKNLEAIDQTLDPNYIQHNPILPDGRDTLKKAAAIWFKGAPKEKIDLQHLAADGDFVFIHTKAGFGGKASSVIDIFRLENNKIVEHWDVIQVVPEKSANPHPMF